MASINSNVTTSYINRQPWRITQSAIPPRSRLYSLEPLGSGTSYVESATSYLIRLSAAHSVSVGTLFYREIIPLAYPQFLSKKDFLSRPGIIVGGSFVELAISANGAGIVAEKLTEALGALTLRKDLRYSTMLTWGGALSNVRLLRTGQAWCPYCYEEWRINRQQIYQPLLWSLIAVTACIRHHCPLLECCQNCNSRYNSLTARSVLGYCPKCKRWLGGSDSLTSKMNGKLTVEERDWQRWVTENVGGLLAAAPHIASPPNKQIIASSLSQCIEQTAKGCTSSFAKMVNIPRPTLGKWRVGNQAPSLGALLEICFKVGVSLLDFLTGKRFEVHARNMGQTEGLIRKSERTKHTQHPRREITIKEEKHIRSTLKKALKADPPKCLKELARELGRNPNSIQYRFPDLSAAVITKYADYMKDARQELGRQMLQALEEAIKGEDPPHSLVEFARSHGWSLKILQHRFPKQCRALTRRCSDERGKLWLELKNSLEVALTEDPPPSVQEFARRYNVHSGILYRRFQDVCHSLSAKASLAAGRRTQK